MHRFLVRGISVVEYLMGFIMIFGGLSTTGNRGPAPDSAMQAAFGSRLFLIGYGVLLIGAGVLLIYAKVRRDRKNHSRALMAVYLLNLFVLLLEVMVFGLVYMEWIDSLVISLVAVGCWLHWKFLTEYVNVDKLRRRMHP